MADQATPSGTTGGADIQSSRFLWLIGIFVVSLMLVVGLKMFFSHLYDEIGERSANERARLFIGEELVSTLLRIEKDVYQMNTLTSPVAQSRMEEHIRQHVVKMQHDLSVLKSGGHVKQVIYLNVEGHDQMVREVEYRPDPEARGYVMESIEIAPQLDQIIAKVVALRELLAKRAQLRENNDSKGLFALEHEIAVYLKHIPPYFFRLNENANRLFFDSSDRLKELERQLAAQRDRFKTTEMVLVALIISLATVAGFVFARQINEANRRLRLALDEMRTAKEEAERASRTKTDFVSRMSHELRTPMNAILGFSQLLESESLTPEHRDYVGEINRAGAHLLELINKVLDLSKIEAGQLTIEHIPFDLRKTLNEVAALVSENAKNKGINLQFITAPELPTRVMGDPTRLRQVLINLIGNAEKFTHEGSVEIRIESEATDGEGSPRIRFSVKDSGIGMDAAALSRLFQPFAQADESTTRKFGGTGLGLKISQDLVHAMGGNIQVESEPGRGSCFWFSLPAIPATEQEEDNKPELNSEPVASMPVPASEETGSLHGHVLLVEDNRINQMVATRMLAKLGLTYDIANHGGESLQRLAERDYDLILMDMEMPQMDGPEATRKIRAMESENNNKRIPIIAMTANAMQEDRDNCLASGMDDHLSKPVEMTRLNELLRQWLPPQT
jgi:signal transduction histidine kinase/ActR/RegA family two-component response regulator